MASTLYIVSRPLNDQTRALIPNSTPANDIRLLLIGDGVRSRLSDLPGANVLAEDAIARGVPASDQNVSYSAMLDMIFGADHVVVL